MAFLSVAQINIVAAAATVCNIYGWKKQQEKENRFRWNNGHGNKSAHWWRPNLMLCVFISLTNLHPFACFFFFFCVLCGGFLLSVWNTFAPMWMFSSFMIAFEADRCMRKWATERESEREWSTTSAQQCRNVRKLFWNKQNDRRLKKLPCRTAWSETHSMTKSSGHLTSFRSFSWLGEFIRLCFSYCVPLIIDFS